MTKYLISFPGSAMRLDPQELAQAGIDAHAVVADAKRAGAYVFGGGIDEGVAPIMVSADGLTTDQTYPGVSLTGGFMVLELPDRETAIEWARRTAAACRCAQELREFMFDPAS